MERIRDVVAQCVAQGMAQAQAAGALPPFELPSVLLDRPRQEGHGDYATPVAMQLARSARMAPAQIARVITEHMPAEPCIGAVEVAGPGFINVTLSDEWLVQQVPQILREGETFGRVAEPKGLRLQVEYGSANPTGPLHVGFARNVILGDVLSTLLEEGGYEVQREYYVNDAGNQMRLFGESLYARYAQALGKDIPVPENGYQGAYMVEWGVQLAEEEGRRYLEMPYHEATMAVGEAGLKRYSLPGIKADLDSLGIRYDRWFSERSLYADGTFDRTMAILRERGYVVERDGAVWLELTRFGLEKDEVLIRSSGEPAYFASDVAYHYNKLVDRGFDEVIDVWGADHQGHVPRMHAMMEALGLDPARLQLLIYQLVTLKRGGEVIRLSKRTGDIVTLRELIDEVSPDAVRYFLVSRSPDSQMDFDLELAVKQSDENPVFYIQYAHARICSVLRLAEASALDYSDADLTLLNHESELALVRLMLRFPEVIVDAAADRAPHRLAYYAYDLAKAFHIFYRDCRIVSSLAEDEALTKARLQVAAAAKVALGRALAVMGMEAPERM